jgi:hypothetical protein
MWLSDEMFVLPVGAPSVTASVDMTPISQAQPPTALVAEKGGVRLAARHRPESNSTSCTGWHWNHVQTKHTTRTTGERSHCSVQRSTDRGTGKRVEERTDMRKWMASSHAGRPSLVRSLCTPARPKGESLAISYTHVKRRLGNTGRGVDLVLVVGPALGLDQAGVGLGVPA